MKDLKELYNEWDQWGWIDILVACLLAAVFLVRSDMGITSTVVTLSTILGLLWVGVGTFTRTHKEFINKCESDEVD